jgi:hypothetical protein
LTAGLRKHGAETSGPHAFCVVYTLLDLTHAQELNLLEVTLFQQCVLQANADGRQEFPPLSKTLQTNEMQGARAMSST